MNGGTGFGQMTGTPTFAYAEVSLEVSETNAP
jgi:hypothetical protein